MFIETKAVDKELFALVFINFLPDVVCDSGNTDHGNSVKQCLAIN